MKPAALLLALVVASQPAAAGSPPSNDDLRDATEVSALPFAGPGTTQGASLEPGETTCAPSDALGPLRLIPPGPFMHTVWYRLATPSAGTLTVRMSLADEETFDETLISVYEPTAVYTAVGNPAGLTAVRCHPFRPWLEVDAGDTVFVQVAARFGSDFDIEIDLVPPEPPENDDFSAAHEVEALPFSAQEPTFYATDEDGEPRGCGIGTQSVWFSLELDADAVIDLDAWSSDFDVMLAVYTGPSLTELEQVGCEPRGIRLEVSAGTPYHIQASSVFDAEPGYLVLRLEDPGPPPPGWPPPPNDDLADAVDVGQLPFNAAVDVSAASLEPDEPTTCLSVVFEDEEGRTVWYRFTPDVDAVVDVNTYESELDTSIGVFRGSELELIRCNDDASYLDSASEVAFAVAAGETYYIQVESTSGIVVFAADAATGPEAGLVSGLSSHAYACSGSDESFHDSEVEPSVAVNPADPQNIVAMWQQDRFPDGAAQGNLAGVTFDGGLSWTTVVVPGISRCAAGSYDRGTDPWVSFDAGGRAYAVSLSINHSTLGGPSAILVNTSSDGGLTWGDPVTVVEDEFLFFNDKETITADPYRPGYAYVVWQKSGVTHFSRTTDGGESWLPPVVIGALQIGDEILVRSDGRLVDVYNGAIGIEARVSLTGGLSWTPPVLIGRGTPREGPTDPGSGFPVRGGNFIPSADVAPDGTIWATWVGPGDDAVMVSSSRDGLVWTKPVVAGEEPWGVFTPSIAVTADGSVGVTYYAFRAGTPPTGFGTHVLFRHSDDGGVSWAEQHIAGPFDISRAPMSDGRGWFLGDYAGLAAAGADFVSIRARTVPRGAGIYSDIYFDRIPPD